MNTKAKIYSVSLFVLSIFIGYYLLANYRITDWKLFLFWCLMAFLSETFMVKLPGGKAVSVGLAIGLAAIIMGGPLMAALVTSIGVVFRMPSMDNLKRANIFRTHPIKSLFNFSETFITTSAAGLVYIAAGGEIGAFNTLVTLFLVISYVIINSLIFALLFKFLTGSGFFVTWLNNNRGFLLNTVAVGMLGIILALANISFSVWAVLLFLGPLFLARYSFKLYMDIKKTYFDTIESLNRTIEAKDPYTCGHANRVGELSMAIASEMRLPTKIIEKIKAASILHDIGKIGVEDSILNKPLELTSDEYEKIKRHCEIGCNIIGDVEFLKDISRIVRHHHEKWDGSGYPDGLAGDAIPVESRILAAADMYDAMTSDRPYRKALSDVQALDELIKFRGIQICPKVCDAFLLWLSTHNAEKKESR